MERSWTSSIFPWPNKNGDDRVVLLGGCAGTAENCLGEVLTSAESFWKAEPTLQLPIERGWVSCAIPMDDFNLFLAASYRDSWRKSTTFYLGDIRDRFDEQPL